VFAPALQAHQANRLPEAIQGYRQALALDPAYYEASYNLGLALSASGNPSAALAAYETALAIQPSSIDARYNFALTLRQAGFLVDAVDEFEKVLAASPNDTRSHLALGNLYAQQLRQPAKARVHYRKLLEIDPRHPQANAIRNWLALNP
jgi:tetratricopeptide (TPR) repeat protein